MGDFYCVNNDSFADENLENLKTEFKISGIYVYVNGKALSGNTLIPLICAVTERKLLISIFQFHFTDVENLLVHNDFPMITGVQNIDIVIPCKPTSKNVAVKLIKEGDEVNSYVRKC